MSLTLLAKCRPAVGQDALDGVLEGLSDELGVLAHEL